MGFSNGSFYNDIFGNPAGSKWWNTGLAHAWRNSQKGQGTPGWNTWYNVFNAIPYIKDLAGGFNSVLEQNKFTYNTGLPYENYNNPATSYAANGFGQMGQPMSRFARTIDEVYGDPYYSPNRNYDSWSNGYY